MPRLSRAFSGRVAIRRVRADKPAEQARLRVRDDKRGADPLEQSDVCEATVNRRIQKTVFATRARKANLSIRASRPPQKL